MREAPRRPARAARRLALLMVGALLLAACSQTQLALHTAKRISKAGGRTDTLTGTYKVGNPYQIGKLWYYPKVDYGYDETGKGGNNADHRVSLTFVRRLKEIGCRDQVAGWVFSPSTAFLSEPSTASVIE